MSLRIAAEYLGYKYEFDFLLGVGENDIRWQIEPHPTDDELRAVELQAMKAIKRAENKAWVASINGRCWEHATGEDFDDVVAAMRTAPRNMINNYAVEAGLGPKVSAAEAKLAYSTAAPEFDLIAKAKEARSLMADEIAALADVASAEAYQVGDATAGQLHAAAYTDASPTLADLLAQFPVRTE